MTSKATGSDLRASGEQRLLFDCPKVGASANGKEAITVAHRNGKNGRSGRRRAVPSTTTESELVALKELIARLESRVAGIEALLVDLHDQITSTKVVKEFYSTAEVAKILGKRPYTVREWCRLGRIRAEKAQFGRGLDEEWRVSQAELVRIQNEGLLAIQKFSRVAVPARLGK